jgi:hypothetical protein
VSLILRVRERLRVRARRVTPRTMRKRKRPVQRDARVH